MSTIKTTHRVTKSNTHRVFVDAEPGHSWRFRLVRPDGTAPVRVEHIPDVDSEDLAVLLAVVASLEAMPADASVEILTKCKTLAIVGNHFAKEPAVRFWQGFTAPDAQAAWAEVPDIAKARWPDVLYAIGVRSLRWVHVADDSSDLASLKEEADQFLATAPMHQGQRP